MPTLTPNQLKREHFLSKLLNQCDYKAHPNVWRTTTGDKLSVSVAWSARSVEGTSPGNISPTNRICFRH